MELYGYDARVTDRLFGNFAAAIVVLLRVYGVDRADNDPKTPSFADAARQKRKLIEDVKERLG